MGRKKQKRNNKNNIDSMGRDYLVEAEILNDFTYMDYYNRLKNLCLNVFKWEGIPPSVDERFLELTLFEYGYCCYFNDEVMGNLALTCAIGGQLDVYRIPIRRRAYANNGYNKELTNKDSVIIFNNYLRVPTDDAIRLFARRLYECERTVDVNVKAQKTPVLILCSEQQRLTMQNMYAQYDGNQPFIFGDETYDVNTMSVLKTDAPFIAEEVQLVKNRIWNEALTYIGIENSNQDKKERMVVEEVNSNYGVLEAQRNVMLNSRRQACDKINAMFGTNISVSYRSELNTMLNNVGGEDIEQIHNSDKMDSGI